MTDLFKKLNVLVKSSLHDLVGDSGTPRREPLTPQRLGKDIDREVAALRSKVNEAVDYEQNLRTRVHQIEEEIARWDAEADNAVNNANDAGARYAVEQMKRAQQRLTIAENDLREHQLVTQELISRVNTLEAAVADARRSQEVKRETSVEAVEKGSLSDVLKNAREKINEMGDVISAQEEITSPVERASAEAERHGIEDDLERRRQRLSRR